MLCAPDDEDYTSDEDEDYLPSGEASEGESEDDDAEEEECEGREVKGHGKAKVKKRNKKKGPNILETKRNRTGGILLPDDVGTEQPKQATAAEEPAAIFKEEEQRAAKMKKEEKEKKKADDLWSSFLNDVGQKPKAQPAQSRAGSSGSLGALSQQQASGGTNDKGGKAEKDDSSASKKTVTVTKVFEFAGEEVKVTKEVVADSKEAKQQLQPSKPVEEAVPTASLASRSAPPIGSKRTAGGLSNVLGLINKKPKMSVLEKSRLDWTNFTATEGITDDLKLHNKGKEGYIEKQKFLAEADRRQYEKERDLRMGFAKR